MEETVHYTDCKNAGGEICSEMIANKTADEKNCICAKQEFTLKEPWNGPVFIYYELENFYQNHRRYVKSRDDKQLLGKVDATPNSECSPFDTCKTAAGECKNGLNDSLPEGTPFLPCGAIANSLFSGKFYHIMLDYLD